MKANIRTILADCIERGIRFAVLNNENVSNEYLMTCLENEIWLQIDEYFTFEDN